MGVARVNTKQVGSARVPALALVAHCGNFDTRSAFDHHGSGWVLIVGPLMVSVFLLDSANGTPISVSKHQNIGACERRTMRAPRQFGHGSHGLVIDHDVLRFGIIDPCGAHIRALIMLNRTMALEHAGGWKTSPRELIIHVRGVNEILFVARKSLENFETLMGHRRTVEVSPMPIKPPRESGISFKVVGVVVNLIVIQVALLALAASA